MRRADLARDAAICKAMAADLNTYLLKDVLFWSLSDSGPRRSPYPQLTLGGLLMRLHHLGLLGGQLAPEVYEVFAHARDEAEAALSSWRVQFERKVSAELAARLRAWSQFLVDCGDTARGCADEYPTQAEVRTMTWLLFQHAESGPGTRQLREQLNGLDRRLKAFTAPGPFVWDPVFREAYPPDPCWWLYVSIRT